MSRIRVLSVGQCGFDHASIRRQLGSVLGAETIGASTRREAVGLIKSAGFDLVLVNRIFDADGDSGLDFIRDLKADPETSGVKVILVSNYESVQNEAEALGALPGFGKSDLDSAATASKLRAALKPEPVKTP